MCHQFLTIAYNKVWSKHHPQFTNFMNRHLVWRRTFCAGAFLWGLCALPAHAATFKVSNLNDNGQGSLRTAIVSANRTPDADTIIFASHLRGTLGIKSSLPSLSGSLSIVGPGRDLLNVRRVGKAQYRIFDIARSGTVSLQEMTLSNGSVMSASGAGLMNTGETGIKHDLGAGCIYNGGVLQVNDCALVGNKTNTGGGAIFNIGPQLTLSNCLIASNNCSPQNGYMDGGGGVLNGRDDAFVLMTHCTFSGNVCSDGSGGAILNSGSARIQILRSTFSQNVASSGGALAGGGEYGGGFDIRESAIINNKATEFGGGGISASQYGGNLTLTNCTVSGNRAAGRGGGIQTNLGGVQLNSCTVFNNVAPKAAGIWACISSRFSNSIIAGNLLPSHAPGTDIEIWKFDKGQTDKPSEGSNFIGRGDATSLSYFHETGDRRNVFPAGLKLGPLRDNGGPTKTHALLADSPAIGKGSFHPASDNFTDQRGQIRNDSGDVGAFQTIHTPPVKSKE